MSDEYATLRKVLDDALDQAANGKGKERHASPGQRFEDQEIVAGCRDLGSNHGPLFQVRKKAKESARLPRAAARRELLGAIVYAAAAVIWLDEQPEEKP